MKSLSWTHFKKKSVEKTQKFFKLRKLGLLSKNFGRLLSLTEKKYWELLLYIKWSLSDALSIIKEKKFKIWIFAPKLISISQTAPPSGKVIQQNFQEIEK